MDQRFNTFCREKCLGRKDNWLRPQGLISTENSVLGLHDHGPHFLMWGVWNLFQARNLTGSWEVPTASDVYPPSVQVSTHSTLQSLLAWFYIPQAMNVIVIHVDLVLGGTNLECYYSLSRLSCPWTCDSRRNIFCFSVVCSLRDWRILND